jgi:hypothetical protein
MMRCAFPEVTLPGPRAAAEWAGRRLRPLATQPGYMDLRSRAPADIGRFVAGVNSEAIEKRPGGLGLAVFGFTGAGPGYRFLRSAPPTSRSCMTPSTRSS